MKKPKQLIAACLSLFFIFLPYLVLGADPLPSPTETTGAGNGGLSFSIKNPLAFDTIQELIVTVIRIIIVIGTPIVVLFVILAGFKYVTAQGNPSKIQEATRSLTYAIIGGVLIIGAFAIAKIIDGFVQSFAG